MATRQLGSKCYPWLVISLGAAFLIYKYILQVSPSVMTNELMRAFHVHAFGLGNLAATFFYAYLITQLFVGILLDKYSLRWLTSLALLISALGAYLFAVCQSLWLAEIGRALMGVGAAFATVSYMKLAAVWFRPNQFAFVAGLLATAAMLGAVFGQAPLSMIATSLGWRDALVFIAILGVFIAVLFALLVRERPLNELESPFVKDSSITWQAVCSVLSNKQNWLLTLYSGLAFAPIAVFGGLWGVPFLKEAHHLTGTSAALLVSTAFIGLAVGGPVLGWLSERYGRCFMMYAGSGISFITLLIVIYASIHNLYLLHLLLFCFGFGTGAFMLGFSIAKENNPAFLAATVVAMINTGDAIFGAFTEPAIGGLLDRGWHGQMLQGVEHFSVRDYHQSLALLPLYLLLTLILVVFVKDQR